MQTPKPLIELQKYWIEQAQQDTNPQLKALAIKQINKLTNACINSQVQVRIASVIIVFFVVTMVAVVYAAIKLSNAYVLGIGVIGIVLSISLSSMYLRACGRLTEKGLLAIIFDILKNLSDKLKDIFEPKKPSG